MDFIVYSSKNEVIVTTFYEESGMISEYFTEGGRDLDNYDREVRYSNGSVIITTGDLLVNMNQKPLETQEN